MDKNNLATTKPTKNFLITPAALLLCPGVKPIEKILLQIITYYGEMPVPRQLSDRKLGELTGHSRTTIRKTIKELETANLLEVVDNGANKAKTYVSKMYSLSDLKIRSGETINTLKGAKNNAVSPIPTKKSPKTALEDKKQGVINYDTKRAAEMARMLAEHMETELPQYTQPKPKDIVNWVESFGRLNIIDGFEWKVIKACLEFALADRVPARAGTTWTGWWNQIRSGRTFREKMKSGSLLAAAQNHTQSEQDNQLEVLRG